MFRRTNLQVEFGFLFARRLFKIYLFLGDAANGENNVGINQNRLVKGNAIRWSSVINLDVAAPIVHMDSLVITEKIVCQ